MPSLRQKVTTYFRQLSFIADPRDGPRSPRKTHAHDDDEDGSFIIKYLEGRMNRIFVTPPNIFNGQNPTDLPVYKIGTYATGQQTVNAASTGPDEGLTGIKRSKLHLCASFTDDIDFIDTTQEADCFEVRKSINTTNGSHARHNKFGRFNNSARKLNNAGTSGPISDQNANRTITTATAMSGANTANNSTTGGGGGGMRSRKNSRTSISNLNVNKDAYKARSEENRNSSGKHSDANNSGKSTTIVVSMVRTTTAAATVGDNANSDANAKATKTTTTTTTTSSATDAANDQNNKNILNTPTTKTDAKNGTTNTNTSTGHPGTEAAITTTTATTTDLANNTTTIKLLESTTERLLREAVSNQMPAIGSTPDHCSNNHCKADNVSGNSELIAGINNWKVETEFAYGISVSLYENNMLTKEPMGNPIADCYGIVVHDDAAVMALADGVNWGDGARLAARSAVHGCLDYLERAIFGVARECLATTTEEVFVSLLRSLWEGHGCILEVGGALSTLTIAVVLPLTRVANAEEDDFDYAGKYVVCACNVGDSLGYIYSKKHGVREFTQASHDISSMRDMRDALGAIGPADGNKPELSNLTFSMTLIEKGDIVFLTSDGVSDNFDPVVGKFAEAWTPDVKLMPTRSHGGILAPKRQNKSASALYARLQQGRHNTSELEANQTASAPQRPPRSKKSASPENVPPTRAAVEVPSTAAAASNVPAPSRPKYMRSHTVIEPRRISAVAVNPSHLSPQDLQHRMHHNNHHNYNNRQISPKIPKSISGLPLVTGPQRHALTLYRLEDLLSYGINGTFSPCVSARRLCHLLIDFVRMITSARRKTLEQRELFYKLATGADGVRREVELNRMQHRAARKRIIDSSAFVALPGKLDHATVVAYTVGGDAAAANNVTVNSSNALTAALQSKEFQETNF